MSDTHVKQNTTFTGLQVADYHDPMSETGSGGLQQGRYSPKPHIWETEFDPIHVLLRVMQRKDFQSSMDRYSAQ